jgi:response regulator RpfG family c-di-GMP phosphodiesterase
MRKPRVIIYDDEIKILGFLTDYFTLRGYEVLAFNEPMHCPVYEEHDRCANHHPCSDIIITDLNMPKMNGIEMLQNQSQRGCRVAAKSRAFMSGFLDNESVDRIKELGGIFFQKPIAFNELSDWLDERERNLDLSQPLGIKRSTEHHECHEEVECLVLSHDEAIKASVSMRAPRDSVSRSTHPSPAGSR